MSATSSPRPRLVPQAGPAAWRAADLRPADWMVPLGADHAGELEAALTEGPAALATLGQVLRAALPRLDTGRGFVLLRALPLERFADAAAEQALIRIGGVLGRAVPQDGQPVQLLESPASGALRWRFHADAADIVALLVLHQPPEVDPAMLVAAATIHNELMKRDRAALEILHRPMPHAVPGGGIADLPVFTTASGAFIGRYARDAIDAAQRLPETPRLTAAQMAALDLVDAICGEAGLALRMEVRPGDLLLFNPLQVWKRRAEISEDVAGAVRQRQALRLLLTTENSRALPGGLLAFEGAPAPGVIGG